MWGSVLSTPENNDTMIIQQSSRGLATLDAYNGKIPKFWSCWLAVATHKQNRRRW